jgi:hypothetical protein
MKWIGKHIWDLVSIFRNDVNVEADVTAYSLKLDTTNAPDPLVQGQFAWNADEETADLCQNGATLQLGQEVKYHCRNNTASTITDGTAVMATGTLGNSGRITIAPMVADGTVEPRFYLGVTTEDIPAGEDGKVTHFGKVRGIDTSAYSDGDVLWCDPATPGALTATQPAAPNLKIATAFVISAHSNGTLFCRANAGIDLHNNHRVQVSSLTDGDILTWDNTDNRWENKKQYSYQYITFLGNSTVQANGDWEFPGVNGIDNHTWTIDGNSSGTTVDTSTITVNKGEQHAGIRIPHDCTLVGFKGMGRNSNGNRIFYGGLFVGVPNWGGNDAINPVLRALGTADNSPGGNYWGKPSKVEDMSRSHALSAGDVIYPAIRGDGANADTIQISFTIVLKVPVTT